jgi:hypothetical protein
MICELSKTVHAGGRPRKWDRDQILHELIEWVKLPENINLNKFCGTREPMLDPAMLSHWAAECDQFRQSYRAAKSLLAARREEWLGCERLHQKAYHLSNKSYNYFDKEEDREEFTFQKELEARIGKEIGQTVNSDIVDRLDKTLSQISSLQDSVRKSAASNIRSDEKS